MPTRRDYDEAFYRSQHRLKVTDDDLRAGQVQTVLMKEKEILWANQGDSAVVYKFHTKSGRVRALRCFTGLMEPTLKDRYEKMGPYFRQRVPDITLDFTYHAQGIVVEETSRGQPQERIYPVIDMEWVEGITLFEYVGQLAQKGDQAKLGNLASKWLEVVHKLRRAHIAHGCLSAADVMVRQDGKLVLVDYDTVYIPAFGGMKHLHFGRRGFQHPQMSQQPFDEWLDDFSSLVIYTTLLALQSQPTLWDKYIKYGKDNHASGQTLLFTHEDFVHPQDSKLFGDLGSSLDLLVREAAQALMRACGQSAALVRFPVFLSDPDYTKKKALAALKQAITVDDNDQTIEEAATKLQRMQINNQALTLSIAEEFRIRLASIRNDAIKRFRRELEGKRPDKVADAYAAVLLVDSQKSLTAEEYEKGELAKEWEAAYQQGDDDRLIKVWETIHNEFGGFLDFLRGEQDFVVQAKQRQVILVDFRTALTSKNIERIISAYSPLLDDSPAVTSEERTVLDLARAFQDACKNEDELKIVEAARQIGRDKRLQFTLAEEQRVQLAIKRKEALHKFQSALQNHARNAQQIVDSYDASLLDLCKNVTQESNQLVIAKRFQQMRHAVLEAIQSGNFQRVNALYDEALAGHFDDFTPQERQKIEAARKADQLEQALAARNDKLALQIAREIEQTTGISTTDVRVRRLTALVSANQNHHPKVFVSHSHKNDDITTNFVADLRAAGVEVWVDMVNMRPGDFVGHISEALWTNEWLVFVLTPEALASPFVRWEVNIAIAMHISQEIKGVIPFMALPCDPKTIPPMWRTLSRHDATSNYQSALAGLLRDLGVGPA